jgi:hypothetical protein
MNFNQKGNSSKNDAEATGCLYFFKKPSISVLHFLFKVYQSSSKYKSYKITGKK